MWCWYYWFDWSSKRCLSSFSRLRLCFSRCTYTDDLHRSLRFKLIVLQNLEVIENVTIPNVLLNTKDREGALKKCEFFSGDWESFTRLNVSDNEAAKYDLIFTSETIYNPDNHKKLYEVFKQRLKQDGAG